MNKTQRKHRIRERMYAEQDGKCFHCRKQMCLKPPRAWNRPQQPDNLATFDHVTARALGGSNLQSNIVLACAKCNNDKAQDEHRQVEFIRRTGRNPSQRDAMQAEVDAYGAAPKPLATLADAWPRK